MRFELAAASLLASTAAAFSDTSPFVLFSTSSEHTISSPGNSQLVTTGQISGLLQGYLASCPTRYYVLVDQPGAHASDLRNPATGECLVPHLCEAAAGPGAGFSSHAAEVVGHDFLSLEEMEEAVVSGCREKRRDGAFGVDAQTLDSLPEQKDMRRAKVIENDTKFGKIISGAAQWNDDYTVIYFSAPREGEAHKPEHAGSPAAQVELKRSVAEEVAPRAAAVDGSSSAPLFVKYQFFTPGIFMGLVAVLIMLAILYVGLSAVSSLQVPYGAFDKEMGPAAQKKSNN